MRSGVPKEISCDQLCSIRKQSALYKILLNCFLLFSLIFIGLTIFLGIFSVLHSAEVRSTEVQSTDVRSADVHSTERADTKSEAGIAGPSQISTSSVSSNPSTTLQKFMSKFIKDALQLKTIIDNFQQIKDQAPTLLSSIAVEGEIIESEQQAFISWITDQTKINETLLSAVKEKDSESVKFILKYNFVGKEQIKAALKLSIENENADLTTILAEKINQLTLEANDLEELLIISLQKDQFKIATTLIEKLNLIRPETENRHSNILGQILYSELCLYPNESSPSAEALKKLSDRFIFLFEHGADPNSLILTPSNNRPMPILIFLYTKHLGFPPNFQTFGISYTIHTNFRKRLSAILLRNNAALNEKYFDLLTAEDLNMLKARHYKYCLQTFSNIEASLNGVNWPKDLTGIVLDYLFTVNTDTH